MRKMKTMLSLMLCALLLTSVVPFGDFAGTARLTLSTKANASEVIEPDIFALLGDAEQTSPEVLLTWFNSNVNRLKNDDFSQTVTTISGQLSDIRHTNITSSHIINDLLTDSCEYDYGPLRKNMHILPDIFPVFGENFVSSLTVDDLQSIQVTEASGVEFLQDLPDTFQRGGKIYDLSLYKNMPVPNDMICVEITLPAETVEDGVYTVGGESVSADVVMPSEHFIQADSLREEYELYPIVEEDSSDGMRTYIKVDCNKIERNSCAVWYFDKTTLEPIACKYIYSVEHDQHMYYDIDIGGLNISCTADIKSKTRNDYIYLFSDYYQFPVNRTTDGIQYAVIDDEAIIVGYTGSATELEMPSVLDGYTVTTISGAAFSNCTKLQSVEIPQGVTSIGDFAFYGCAALTSIDIPQGITSIGDSTFYNCTALESVEIPQGVTSIGDSAFYGCTSLASIEIPQGVTSIGNSTFNGCTALESINIPQGVTNIGDYAFYGCSALESIDISQGITSIGDSTFYNCTALESVEIPQGVTSIGDSAFYGCTSLASIEIPQGVTSIGDSTFNGCAALTSIDIPQGITSIGGSTFYNCTALESVEIPQGVTSIGDSAFYGCTSLASIEIPQGVTSIGDSTFNGCAALTSIDIPQGVTSIGVSAFACCDALNSVVIPQSVESIALLAFTPCESMTEITILNRDCSLGAYVFPNNVTIYGYSDSTAQKYAEKSGNTFIPLDKQPVQPGNGGVSLEADWELDENGCIAVEVYIDDAVGATAWEFDMIINELFTFEHIQSGTAVNEAAETENNLMIIEYGEYYPSVYGTMQKVMFTQEDFTASAKTGTDAAVNPEHAHIATLWFYVTDPDTFNQSDVEIGISGTVDFQGYADYRYYYAAVETQQVSNSINRPAVVDPHPDHVWDGGTVTTEPTCTEKGVRTYTCTLDASHTYTEDISAIGHDYKSEVTREPALHVCGEITYTCNNCGDVYTDDTEMLHDYKYSIIPATCTQWEMFCMECSCGDKGYGDTGNPPLGHDYKPVVTAPTCTNDGYATYICTRCEDSYVADETPASGHTSGADATCTEDQTCTVCGEVLTEKLGHDYNAVVTAPTCEDDGFATYTCLTCGDSYTADEVTALGHAYVGTITTAPTCTTAGVKTYVCSNDASHTYTESIVALGHTPGADATCTEDQVCTVCGEVLTEKLGHNYNTVVTAPTCENGGFTTYTCAICGDTYVADEVATLGHAYVGAITTNPTCTTAGVKTYVCSNDASHTYTEAVAALGHTPGTDATCTTDQTCTVCGEVLTEKLGHDYNSVVTAPTCAEDGYTICTCSTCGDSYVADEVAALGHSWDEGVVTTEPTVEAEGVMTYTCFVCGATKTEPIEKLQPAFTESEDAVITDDGNICVNIGKTAEALLVQASDGATLVDKNGNALSADSKVGTGAVLTLADGTQYEIIVPGDVDGDGNISASDARLALRASVGLETYDETSVQYKAAKVKSADTISASDARLILRASVGLDDPNEWFDKIA